MQKTFGTGTCFVCSGPAIGMRVTCSPLCLSVHRRKISTGNNWHTPEGNARLSDLRRVNNPMFNSRSRARMRKTLKAIGHKPHVRGGNGMPTPLPVTYLLSLLGEGWELELAIPTRIKRGLGYPTCYKVDLGNRSLMTCIEVDGQSHGTLKWQAADKKKSDFLAGAGWRLIRFTNKEALAASSTTLRSKALTPTSLMAS